MRKMYVPESSPRQVLVLGILFSSWKTDLARVTRERQGSAGEQKVGHAGDVHQWDCQQVSHKNKRNTFIDIIIPKTAAFCLTVTSTGLKGFILLILATHLSLDSAENTVAEEREDEAENEEFDVVNDDELEELLVTTRSLLTYPRYCSLISTSSKENSEDMIIVRM